MAARFESDPQRSTANFYGSLWGLNILKHVKAWLESFSCTPSSAPCGLTRCQTRTAGFSEKEKTWRNHVGKACINCCICSCGVQYVQANSFVGIKKNINFSGKEFLKGKVVACFYTILSKFGKLPVCRSSAAAWLRFLLSMDWFLTALARFRCDRFKRLTLDTCED